jgi:hypothetical protein
MVYPSTLKKSNTILGHNKWISSSYRKRIQHHAATSKFPTTPSMTHDTLMAAHGGTAILIKNGLKHYLHGHYTADYLQATSITVEDWVGPLTIAAVYCPPNQSLKLINSDNSTQHWDAASWRAATITRNIPTGDPGSQLSEEGNSSKPYKRINCCTYPRANRHIGQRTGRKYLIYSTLES